MHRDAAIEKLRRAIEDEGVSPAYHRAELSRMRLQWPALWSAIDAVIHSQPNPERSTTCEE